MIYVSEAPHGRDYLNRKIRRVVARCACGSEKSYLLSSIRRGDTKSCGCAQELLRMKRAAAGRTFDVEGVTYVGWGAVAEAYGKNQRTLVGLVNEAYWTIEQALGLEERPPWGTSLLKRYGITPDQWLACWSEQGECCAICETTDSGTRGWCMDHDHKTGDARGILCIRCNSFLGALETSNILPRAQRYLQDPPILKR